MQTMTLQACICTQTCTLQAMQEVSAWLLAMNQYAFCSCTHTKS